MALDRLFQHLPPDDRQAAIALLRVQLARRRRRAPARIAREEKRCPGCQSTKPATEFGLNRARPDGLQVYCRECR